MLLPGGVISANGIERSFSFKPLTGMVELAIAEEVASVATWPTRISGVLSSALAAIGSKPVEFNLVHDLAVGDRQYLAMRLNQTLNGEVTWLTRTCQECGKQFDVSVESSRLPVKPASAGFPYADVQLKNS